MMFQFSCTDLPGVLEDSDQSQSGSHFVLSNEMALSGQIVSSCSMTFRDPETGTIYWQTQLLQDDPPSPELYCPDLISIVDVSDDQSTFLSVDISDAQSTLSAIVKTDELTDQSALSNDLIGSHGSQEGMTAEVNRIEYIKSENLLGLK